MKKRVISIVLLLGCVLMFVSAAVLQTEQQKLSEKLIRLHVVANSDSAHDQQIKLHVRDAILEKTQPLLRGADDPRGALEAHLDEIAQAAQSCLNELGEDAPVRVRVTIGEGEGHNWWCVVFPSICLTASMDELELAAQTAGFSDGEIRLITGADEGFVLKFRALELLQRLKALLEK